MNMKERNAFVMEGNGEKMSKYWNKIDKEIRVDATEKW